MDVVQVYLKKKIQVKYYNKQRKLQRVNQLWLKVKMINKILMVYKKVEQQKLKKCNKQLHYEQQNENINFILIPSLHSFHIFHQYIIIILQIISQLLLVLMSLIIRICFTYLRIKKSFLLVQLFRVIIYRELVFCIITSNLFNQLSFLNRLIIPYS